jgi:hypothetical protein
VLIIVQKERTGISDIREYYLDSEMAVCNNYIVKPDLAVFLGYGPALDP